MVQLEWVFLMQICMGILMIVFLQKLIQIKRQVEKVVREVSDYITYVTESIEEAPKENFLEEPEEKRENLAEKKKEKEDAIEAQNRLIQAVLSEYFP